MKARPAVIILRAGLNGLGIAQILSRAGVRAYLVDSTRNLGSVSFYAEFVKGPDPRRAATESAEFLKSFCAGFAEKPVVIPTSDDWSVVLSRSKYQFSDVCRPCVASEDCVDLLVDKVRFAEDPRVPAVWRIPTFRGDEVSQLADSYFPIVAKPRQRQPALDQIDSSCLEQRLESLRLITLKNREELKEFKSQNQDIQHLFMFQQKILGLSDRMYTLGIYADSQSRVVGRFSGRKVRGFPAEFGDCIVGENSKLPPEIISGCSEFVKKIGFQGIAEFEFKQDPMTGRFFLIEVNPRSWSWVTITPYAGVNLPLIAYRCLTGESVQEESSDSFAPGSIKFVKLIPDFFNCVFHYPRDWPSWRMSPLDWIRSLRAQKLIIAEVHRGDFFVFLYALVLQVYAEIRTLFSRHKRGKSTDAC